MDFQYQYNYSYPGDYRGGDGLIAGILIVYVLFLAGIMILALCNYIIHSFAIYKIGKRMGKQYPWLAFIPYARKYFHGSLAGEIELKNRKIRNPGLWKLLLPIIAGVISSCLMVFFIFILVVNIAVITAGGSGMWFSMLLLIVVYLAVLVVAVLSGAAISSFNVLVNIRILRRFTTENMAIVHSVLAIFIPLYESICLFVMRNREFNPGMEPEIPSETQEAPVYPTGMQEPPVYQAGTQETPVYQAGPEAQDAPGQPEEAPQNDVPPAADAQENGGEN